MNHDDFEDKLLSLTRDLRRPDPTAGWKNDILSRAVREAQPAGERRLLPPRWLLATWSVAWAAVFLLNLSAPRTPVQSIAWPAMAKVRETPPISAPTLLAYNRRLNLNLDLP